MSRPCEPCKRRKTDFKEGKNYDVWEFVCRTFRLFSNLNPVVGSSKLDCVRKIGVK